MPKGRMLSKKISQDEKVAKLSLKATLLYTWCIPHLDVEGRIYGNVWTLKSIVPHIEEIGPNDIDKCIKEWVEVGLVFCYGNGYKYLEFKGFHKNQAVRKDREGKSEIPAPATTPTKLQQNSNNTPAQIKLKQNKLKQTNTMSAEIEKILDYLNATLETNYKPTTQKTKDLVKARLGEGFTTKDFKVVIDKKTKQWLKDEKMSKFLRPETLFSNKFEGYLNEKVQIKKGYKKYIRED